LNERAGFRRGHPDLDGAPFSFADQSEDAFAVRGILWMNAATEPAIGIETQVFTLSVLTCFGASRATCLSGAIAQLAEFFEFGKVEAHLNWTPWKPRWLFSLRSTL
jgi:hypothetical protein